MTEVFLFPYDYVAGYNMPLDLEIWQAAQYSMGWRFNYANDPRAVLFK